MRTVPALPQQPSRLASARYTCRSAAMQAARQPATSVAAAAVGSGGGAEPAAPQLQQRQGLRTCRRCKQQFEPATNGPSSCRYHSALWTGGEISKASRVSPGNVGAREERLLLPARPTLRGPAAHPSTRTLPRLRRPSASAGRVTRRSTSSALLLGAPA